MHHRSGDKRALPKKLFQRLQHIEIIVMAFRGVSAQPGLGGPVTVLFIKGLTLMRFPVAWQMDRFDFALFQPDPLYSPGFYPLLYLAQLTRIKPDPMLGADISDDPASAHEIPALHQLPAYRAMAVDDDIDMARIFRDLGKFQQINVTRAFDGVVDHGLEFIQIEKDAVTALAALYQERDLLPHIDGLKPGVTDRTGTVLVGTDVYERFDIMQINVVAGTAIGADDPALWQRGRTAGAFGHCL
jgi:hypothetical protein